MTVPHLKTISMHSVMTLRVYHHISGLSGVDPIIVEVRFVHSGEKHSRPRMWVKSVQRNIHSHDVRALAITSEGKLFSGGELDFSSLFYLGQKINLTKWRNTLFNASLLQR